MFAPFLACVEMSPPPMPPQPIPARLTFSLGGTKPAPPRTCRGTIVNVNAAAAPVAAKNLRRVVCSAVDSLWPLLSEWLVIFSAPVGEANDLFRQSVVSLRGQLTALRTACKLVS